MIENDSIATAIGHLEMIVQAAKGEYSPRKGELEKRQAAVVAFIRTGQCVASDEDRLIQELVANALKGEQYAQSVV